MAGLIAQIEETAGSDIWVAMASRFTNGTGTPIVSANPNDDGRAIADTYSLTFASVVAGVSANVSVTCASPNNPYNGTTTGIALDGTTEYIDIIGGVTLIFSSSGSFANTWTAEIRVGHSFGAFEAFAPNASVPSESRRIRIQNTGADSGENAFARLITRVRWFKKTGRVFVRVYPFAENAVEKLTSGVVSPYAFQVSNVTGSGASTTMDVTVDGLAVTVKNLTDLTTGSSVGLNVVDYYQITTGDLTGVTFLLSENAVNSDIGNVLIFSPRFTQIAPDAGGAPGDWGVSDIALTEDGKAAGVITASGVAYFHTRIVVPDGSNALSNPYICDPAIQGDATGGAGWTA